MLKIKEEYLDLVIYDVPTRSTLIARFIDKELYDYFYNRGYDYIFEKEEKKVDKK